MNNSKPVVSICMITFNHEKFIAQAIDSVLAQKTDFNYELVIGEDCSLDKTRSIIKNYIEKFPKKIRLLKNEQNLGMNKNFIRTFSSCNGDYIALLEGDDFWLDPEKLQKQYNFLNSNPDYTLCFHKVKCFMFDNSIPEYIFPNFSNRTEFDIYDLINQNFISTPSVFFKNNLFKQIPDYFISASVVDHYLHILNAHYGKIKLLDGIMAAYRMHPGGIWSLKYQKNVINNSLNAIETLKQMNRYFNYKYDKAIRNTIANYYEMIIETYQKNEKKIRIQFQKELPILYIKMYLNKFKKRIIKSIFWGLNNLFKKIIHSK